MGTDFSSHWATWRPRQHRSSDGRQLSERCASNSSHPRNDRRPLRAHWCVFATGRDPWAGPAGVLYLTFRAVISAARDLPDVSQYVVEAEVRNHQGSAVDRPGRGLVGFTSLNLTDPRVSDSGATAEAAVIGFQHANSDYVVLVNGRDVMVSSNRVGCRP